MYPLTAQVGETMIVTFDFSRELVVPWRPDWQYSVGEYVTINSYVYECTNAGKTALRIPENLTTTIGATEDDGTVEWTCRDFSTSGTDTISTRTVTADSGITVDSSSITKNVYVDVTFTTTAIGRNDIDCEITTAGGETLIATLTVLVK